MNVSAVTRFLPPLRRDHWQRRIDALDPATDFEEISRITAQHEFPWDVQQALSFALFRTYAVPTIGRLLHETAEFTHDVQKRHDDTALILASVLDHGMESRDGRGAVRRMNQMHGSYDISNDDMRYVLSTFVVSPIRWIERYGWRRPTPVERDAAVTYYRRLGRLMGIREVPDDFAGFERLMEAYERATYARDPRTREVADATLHLLTTFYWRPLRPAVRVFAIALLDDHLRDAFGYRRPPAWVVGASHAGLRLRGRLVRWFPPRREPLRVQDLARIRSYPGGFMVEHLGTFPEQQHRQAS